MIDPKKAAQRLNRNTLQNSLRRAAEYYRYLGSPYLDPENADAWLKLAKACELILTLETLIKSTWDDKKGMIKYD